MGDVILALDGDIVSGIDDLVRLLDAGRIGKTVDVHFLRGDRRLRLAVAPEERASVN